MTSLLALAAAASVLATAPNAPQDRGAEVTARYHEAAAEDDAASLVALWKEHPDLVLVTIDADLEGALSLRESEETPDEEAISALHRRALFGARAADEATGHPILWDYVSSFVGWDGDEQKRFRAGQAAFGRARRAAAEGDHAAAAEAGLECVELAEPLGDWWGTAMGHSAHGRARLALGEHEAALVSLSRARMIYRDLGLFGSELSNLRGMIEALVALERFERARAALTQALALAASLGDDAARAELSDQLTRVAAR